MTFVTAATPALFKGATVPNQSVTVSSKGHAAVSVGCPSGAGRCTGTLALLRHGSKFASSHFTIAAGSNAKVPVTIGRSIRRLLARTHKLVVTARTSSKDARGTATTRSVKITLKM